MTKSPNLSWKRSMVLAAALASGIAMPAAHAQEKPAETPATQPSAKRSAETILSDYDAAKFPQPDMEKIKAKDAAYFAEYSAASKKVSDARSVLAKELFDNYPENDRLPTIMESRWMNASYGDEAEKVIAAGTPEMLLPVAYGTRVTKAFRDVAKEKETEKQKEKLPELKTAVTDFEKRFPTDKRASAYNEMMLRFLDGDEKAQLEKYIATTYPKSSTAMRLKSREVQMAGIGKPFELKFEDAISGHAMSMDSLRGKVVVIDFWATWCGPCVAEMPKMKTLYAEYKDKGVEFIGVSLDQPEDTGKGLTKLKDFVAKNEIGWPQYYQGNFWNSAFSKGWGVNAIPCVFVVDKEGKLYSTEGRGKLEEMIPALLAKGTGSTAGTETPATPTDAKAETKTEQK